MSETGGLIGEKTSGDSLVVETTTANFRKDVIAESAQRPVLVDFWAPWCGPCRQLTPVLEKVVGAAGGKVKLVKLNIDEHPQIPGQLGIQSIPAVIAFQRGQPVDGFMGALPESQVRAFIERLVGPSADPVAALLEEATTARGQGDEALAEEIYHEILAAEPGQPKAVGALASILVARGELEAARDLLNETPEDQRKDADYAAAATALDLAEQASSLGNPLEFERRLERDPADHDARFNLALALNARGDRAAAADALLEGIRREPHWNEDAARKQLLQFFEAWGPMDADTVAARRRLSALLFA